MCQMSVLKKRLRKRREIEILKTLSERLNFHVNLEQKAELIVQRECAEADMDIRNWEQRNAVFALCETNRELESQRLPRASANCL